VQPAPDVTKFYMSCFLSTLLAGALAAVSFVPVSSPAAQTIEPDPPLATQLRKSDELLLKQYIRLIARLGRHLRHPISSISTRKVASPISTLFFGSYSQ
jgi:hypothetical protein